MVNLVKYVLPRRHTLLIYLWWDSTHVSLSSYFFSICLYSFTRPTIGWHFARFLKYDTAYAVMEERSSSLFESSEKRDSTVNVIKEIYHSFTPKRPPVTRSFEK